MRRGFDNVGLNQGLLLSLPMREGIGAVTYDEARPHHPMTLVHAPAWSQLASGISVLTFDGANDYISCSAANSLDLAAVWNGLFSGCIWFKQIDMVPAWQRLMVKVDAANTKGWSFNAHRDNRTLSFISYTPTGFTLCSNGIYDFTSWWLAGFSRISVASVRLYLNGYDGTFTVGDHSTMDDPATENFTIGHTIDPYAGSLWNPRIWNRALTAAEHLELFNQERHLFGV
jgi:hypothetical protein